MKKTMIWTLAVLLCLSLWGCSSRDKQPESETATPPAQETATPAPETQTPEPALQTPAPTEEPVEETPALSPEETDLIGILMAIYDGYQPGTAGCSLHCARYAAMLLDYMSEFGHPDAVRGGAANFAAVHDVSAGYETPEGVPVDFPAKLMDVYAEGMRLSFGENLGILSDAGYVPAYSNWTPEAAQTLFENIYEGCGIELPERFPLYYSDDNLERFVSVNIPAASLNEYTVLGALKQAGTVPMETEILSFTDEGDSLILDLSSAFRERINTMGSSGEYMLMGSLVNTYLDAFDAGSLVLKVDGGWLESGHVIYDFPQSWYKDNTPME